MSLRFRLNMAIAMSMFLIVSAGTIFTIYTARQSVRQEVQSSINLALQSLDSGLAESTLSDAPLLYWQHRLALHSQTRHLKVRIESSNGQVMEFPEDSVAEQPIAPAWFEWLVHSDPIRVVRRVETPSGEITITLNDEPNDEISEAWGEARGFLVLVVLQALLVFVLVHVTIGRALRSVPIILEGFKGLKAGDYSLRLPQFSLPEFSSISNAFNHAASSLQRAHAENQALTARSLTLQEEERRTLSRELHDELGQSLTGIKVLCSAMRSKLGNDTEEIDSIVSICDHLFGVVRSMMRRLRPTMLEDLGLAASLEDMLSSWQQQNQGIEAELDFDPKVENCSTALQLSLFRIVQESLSNVSRHAQASSVTISLNLSSHTKHQLSDKQKAEKSIRLEVKDDGCGAIADLESTGFGLMGIRERAQSHEGEFHMESKPDKGVTIIVEIPYKEDEE